MQPLPAAPYEYAEWQKVRVNIDYHVALDKHYYSVPYQLVKQQLDARVTTKTVELIHKSKRGRQSPALVSARPAHHGELAHAQSTS